MIVLASFIPGMDVGIEIFLGDDLQDGDKFAMNINLFIVRFTLIVSE